MKKIYIAGPMRGYPRFNFPAFDKARDYLALRWEGVISPADLDREEGFDPDDDEPDEQFIRAAIDRDCKAIIWEADALALLPGWEFSAGSKMEVALANFLGLPIYLYPSMVEVSKEDILIEALRIGNGARAADYGHPYHDYKRATDAFNALRGHNLTPADGTCFMRMVKESRQANRHKRDNCTDGAGYWRCENLINEFDEQTEELPVM